MSKEFPQVKPGGSMSISNEEIIDINEAINNDNITNLEAAKILISFVEQINLDIAPNKEMLTKLQISESTHKEVNKIINKGYYTNKGSNIPISPKINIVSHLLINSKKEVVEKNKNLNLDKMAVEESSKVSWAEEMENINKLYYNTPDITEINDNNNLNKKKTQFKPNVICISC